MSRIPSREEALFADALAQPAAHRVAFLAQACGADASLLGRLIALVAAHEGPESLLADAPVPSLAAVAEEKPGDLIGHYKLLQKLGEGACGVVWMAEQEEPVRRRVALKVIKLGMDTKAVVARFEAERQALAMMDHPNIAKVHDAGATETGRPFFVMELVRGIPITKYCDENHLTPKDRLELFIKVCQAVQHAHQKGIIHRDLKPSNILVTVNDGAPTPKVIDFGIAKATQGRLTDATVFTAFEQFIGTPVYMSPEQAEMSSLDIDTRSDIYSLGVLLYELLTGRPPFDPKKFAEAGVEGIRRQIREIEPPRPSARLRTLDDDERTTIARLRNTAASELSIILRGDLDWIVMRCIEKDRTRRYDTANGLAMDIQRYLRNEPVVARPPSTAYLLQKLIRRNRVAFAGGVTVAIVLVAGAIVSTWLAVRARRAEQEQVRARGEAETAREQAVAAESAERGLRERAVAEARLRSRNASRTDFKVGSRLLDEDRVAEGLAYLVRSVRTDPQNYSVGPRLTSALASRDFLLPVAAPVKLPSGVKSIVCAGDGSVFVVGEDGIVRVLPATGGRVVREFSYPGKVVTPIAFAAKDERVFAVGLEDGSLVVADTVSGRPRSPSIHPPQKPHPLLGFPRLSPDGRWLAAASADNVWIWDVRTGDLRSTLPHPEIAGWYEFSPDSQRIVTCAFKDFVRVWSVPDGIPLTPPIPSGSETRPATFSPDGQLIAVGANSGDVRILDSATGRPIGPVLAHGSLNIMSRFTPDGRRIITVGIDGTAKVWDMRTAQLAFPPLQHDAGFMYWSTVQVSRDGRVLLTTAGDGFTRIWNLDAGKRIAEPFIQHEQVARSALSPDGRSVYAGTSGGLVFVLPNESGAAQPMRLPRTEKFVTAQLSADLPVKLRWGTSTALKIFHLVSGQEAPGGFAYPERIARGSILREDGRYLAVQTERSELQVWELAADELRVVRLEEAKPEIVRFGFGAGNLVWMAPWIGQSIRAWHVSTGRPATPQLESSAPLYQNSADMSPSGNRLAVGASNGTARIWEVPTGRHLVDLQPLPHIHVARIVFSPDGARIMTSSVASDGGEVRLWDAVTFQPTSPVLRNRTGVDHAVAFSPDSRKLGTGSHDGTVRITDAITGSPIGEPMMHTGWVQGLHFNPAGTRLATVANDGVARVWDSTSGLPLTEAMRHRGPMANWADFDGRETFIIPSNGKFSPDGRFLHTFSAGEVTIWPVPPDVGDTPVPE